MKWGVWPVAVSHRIRSGSGPACPATHGFATSIASEAREFAHRLQQYSRRIAHFNWIRSDCMFIRDVYRSLIRVYPWLEYHYF